MPVAQGAAPRPARRRPAPSGRRDRAPTSDESITTVHASLLCPDDPSVRDAVDRLTAEFAGHLPTSLVERIVRGSRDDLDSVPTPALPEMVERLARQRLIEHAG